ncbi:hypothetical protein [Psychrobacter sp. DAB_AL43B]|uniref:hypothetical protein n=1 Tax=Psychrobacter sp. DAB_AL43B TaxID=1028416 RepID=UPI0009A8CDBB|nr:hypothetical protein [Psychrobacter sp. DAB_AL43B]SLJ84064.1 hypothetical protein DABAL43B_0865 [Psychrobacter sp. DAB_AL43B]
MKNLILISSILLFGCGAAESIDEKLSTDRNGNDLTTESNTESTSNSSVDSDNFLSNKTETSDLNDDTQDYDAQKSLGKILDSGDSREVVYLIHPTDELLTYCYHDVRSECYIEGVRNSQFFKYDISQVEGQNKGKLTSPGNPIDSAKTTPMKWLTVNDEYAQVLMTSKIMLNSQQYTLHEPLVIDYEAGMMVR